MENFDGVCVSLEPGTTLIEASAGTGKTYSIATLYLRLVMEQGVRVEEILAVTYTDAATKELVGRIRTRLASAQALLERWVATGEESAEEPVVEAWLARGQDLESAREAITRLRMAVQLFDDAVISTIHGFCYRALREYAFESGARYAAELLGESAELYEQVAADFWRRRIGQASALVSGLALARGLAELSAWTGLMRAGLKPGECYWMPELEPLPLEQREARLSGALEEVRQQWGRDREVILSLINGKAVGISENQKTGLPPERLAEYDAVLEAWCAGSPDWDRLLAALERLSPSSLQGMMLKGKDAPQHSFFSACAAALEEVDRYFLALRRLALEEAAGELDQIKRERNVLLFDDLLKRFHEALVGPGGDRLAAAVGAKYRAVLIDEFQDTDPLQTAIFERLFGGGAHQLFLIGDPKQAIYAFRGADITAYLTAAWKAERQFGLTTNWRSDARLLRGMNALFAQHDNPFREEAIRFRSVEAAPKSGGEREPAAPLVLRQIPVDKSEIKRSGLAKDKARERVIADLAAMVLEKRSQYAYGEMAVLVSKHHEAAAVQAELMRRNIPAVRQTRESVLTSEEAAQMQVLMEAVVEPQQSGRVARALLLPLFRAGEVADAAWMMAFLEWRGSWREEGFVAMWQRLLVEADARRRLLRRERGERRLTNFLHLAELIHSEESERRLGPESLLVRFRALRREAEEDDRVGQLRLESDAEAVQIVTIHKSKGLEYPLVFLPFLWDGGGGIRKTATVVEYHDNEGRLMVDLRGCGAPDEVKDRVLEELQAEQQRLLYVAVTRARNGCVIYWGDFSGYDASPLGYLLPDAAAMARLVACEPESVVLEVAGEESGARASGRTRDRVVRGAREFQRSLTQPPLTTSFTGLTRGAPAETPERDEAEEPPLVEETAEPEGIHAFARGARAGDLIHKMMEEVPFARGAAEERQRVISRLLALYGFPLQPWSGVLDRAIASVLELELEPGLRLAELPEGERLVEADFSCRLPSLTPEDIADVARRFPEEFAEVGRLQFPEVRGFLRGAIDLFFRHNGRYYLLDWKSNQLGNSAAAYTPARMQAAMREHHYGLQARLYTLAADRYLQLRLPGYDYERDFGGIFYLFLRGAESEGGGVVRLRPSLGVVEAMRDWMEVRR